MTRSMVIQSQLLATKFFIPMTSRNLISRPRLHTLLGESLKYPLTLVSAPAGFGKTMLLSCWAQSLEASHIRIAWVSLDEEDNDPRLFWTYALSALDQQQPERFTLLFKYLQSPKAPPLLSVLNALCTLVQDSQEHFVLILDDYHLITEQQIHITLAYLVEHLPIHLHIILATRVDPLLPLQRRGFRTLEIRTEQLRCTAEETEAFFKQVKGTHLPDGLIQEVTARTEGWLVGLQLLGLSLSEQANPASLLEEASGQQRYILDYLTEVVLGQQPQDVQAFLLSTCILERLTASLCDALLLQTDSQQMLQRLEQANLFVVALDSKRQWYRYHALFAEALFCQLEKTQPDLVFILHYRASLWYAEHDQTAQAILHAFKAREWQWAADLIEQKSIQVSTYTWGASEYELIPLRQWIEQLPLDVVSSRPQLCVTCVSLLSLVAPQTIVKAWLEAVEMALTTSFTQQMQEDVPSPLSSPKGWQEQQNLLGTVIAIHAFLLSYGEHGETALPLCQQALPLLSADHYYSRIIIAWAQLYAYYYSMNDAEAAIRSGLQGVSLAQRYGHTSVAITAICAAARHMKESGQLHEAQRLIQQAMQLGTKPGGLLAPEAGHPAIWQAELLREWNQLDAARGIIEKAIPLCKKSKTPAALMYIFLGHAVLLRISLSCGNLEAAQAALLEIERIGKSMSQPAYLYLHCFYTTVDQVRLWLACGEQDRAMSWAEQLELGGLNNTLFAREREEVARVRILLAKQQPDLALLRLEPVLQRATSGKHWGHVIEIQLLQALAYQMCQQETQALDSLSEAVRLGEPEGYIRSFVDEGAPMETLLYRLRKRYSEPIAYLDTLLVAFEQENKAHRLAVELQGAASSGLKYGH